jgi:transcriptional regulator with XRE-family HTH domain
MERFAHERLKERRVALGLSQTAVAFAIGRSFETYRLYEQGKYAPTAKVLPSLAAALRCRVEDFFTEAESNG